MWPDVGGGRNPPKSLWCEDRGGREAGAHGHMSTVPKKRGNGYRKFKIHRPEYLPFYQLQKGHPTRFPTQALKKDCLHKVTCPSDSSLLNTLLLPVSLTANLETLNPIP